MKYDAHNRMTEFSTGSGVVKKTWCLKYDPIGRVFRKEEYLGESTPVLQAATHYYYKGGALVQEYDEWQDGEGEPTDAIQWDYLRGAGGVLRRRGTVEEVETDTLHYNDMLGTAKEEGDPTRSGGGTANGYVITAEGEPMDIAGGQPSSENHIQYHGGFLEGKEWHTAADSDRGYLYRMGVRHYSPALGRFLQRDPLSYMGAPSGYSPLSINPYAYGLNDQLAYSDTSGYQACCGGGGFGGYSPGWGGSLPDDPTHPGHGQAGPVDPYDFDGPWCKLTYPPDCQRFLDKPCCCMSNTGATNPICGCNTVPFENMCLTDDIQKYGECTAWCCCMARRPEENAPAQIGSSSGSQRYYGPPKVGPDGGACNPWWFIPVIPWLPSWPIINFFGSDNPAGPSNTSYALNHYMFIGFNTAFTPTNTIIEIGGIVLGGLGVTSGFFACDALSYTADCFVPGKGNLSSLEDFAKAQCVRDVCCRYNGCATNTGLVGTHVYIIGWAAYFTPWGHLIRLAGTTILAAGEWACRYKLALDLDYCARLNDPSRKGPNTHRLIN